MNKIEISPSEYLLDYNEIVQNSNNTLVVNTQWNKEGDFFQQFSTYDDSYISTLTLGNTTLLNKI